MTRSLFFRILAISLIFIIPELSYSQLPEDFHTVQGLPTKEIYNLHVDKKGYLWIAHNLGLSRYDGVNFTHFSCPDQTSLAISEPVEDDQGRIWCHNFSGQVFYVENEKMILLRSYLAKDEKDYPHLKILGKWVIATSSKGLFVCNTENFQSEYITKCNNSGKTFSTTSLALTQNKVIATDYVNLYQLMIKNDRFIAEEVQTEGNRYQFSGVTLETPMNEDTVYGASGYRHEVIKGVLRGNNFKLLNVIEGGNFVNSIIKCDKHIWINTRDRSFTLDDKEEIKNCNFTDFKMDKEGNTWASSFTYGLLIKYHNDWKKDNLTELEENDFVRSIIKAGDKIIYGTQQGKVIFKNELSQKTDRVISLPGSIENLYYGDQGLIIGNNSGIYFWKNGYKYPVKIIEEPIKDAVFTETSVYIVSFGLQKLTFNSDGSLRLKYYNYHRCRSLAYDSISKLLLISFKEGVFETNTKFDSNVLLPVLYKKKQITASTIKFSNGKFYMTGFDGSMYVKNNSSITLSGRPGKKLNIVISAKLFDDHLWLIRPYYIRAYDTKNEKPLIDLLIPPLGDNILYDLAETNNKLIASTSKGLYSLDLSKIPSTELKSYLLNVSVNSRDTSPASKLILPSNYNNIDFNLSVPYYTNPAQIYFKYRLLGNSDPSWDSTENLQREVHYASLQPAQYKFEAIAVNPQLRVTSEPIYWEFTISPPWYKTLWFKISMAISLLMIGYLLNRNKKMQLLRLEKLRREITSDLHDDIGATLSSINIYAELAKTKKDNIAIIESIQNNTLDALNNLDDLVWNINQRTEPLDILLKRMKSFALPLLAAKNINCHFNTDIEMEDLHPSAHKASHIYFTFKELINNVVKHSGAQNCNIYIVQKTHNFELSVIDDGKGFDVSKRNKLRNGIENIYQRAKELHGHFKIDSEIGKGTSSSFIVDI